MDRVITPVFHPPPASPVESPPVPRMARFFIAMFLLVSLYTGWSAVGLWMTQAHSISDVRLPLERLVEFRGDKNGTEYTERLARVKDELLRNARQQAAANDYYLFKIGCLAAFQVMMTVWLAIWLVRRKTAQV